VSFARCKPNPSDPYLTRMHATSWSSRPIHPSLSCPGQIDRKSARTLVYGAHGELGIDTTPDLNDPAVPPELPSRHFSHRGPPAMPRKSVAPKETLAAPVNAPEGIVPP
jgi:hypothetical protein